MLLTALYSHIVQVTRTIIKVIVFANLTKRWDLITVGAPRREDFDRNLR